MSKKQNKVANQPSLNKWIRRENKEHKQGCLGPCSQCEYKLPNKTNLKDHVEHAHEEPIGDLKTVAGIEPNILNSKVFSQAKTCDDNVKSVKRKYFIIETETSTINSPSKRPNSEFYKMYRTFPHNLKGDQCDTSEVLPSLNPSTKQFDTLAASAVDKVQGTRQHLSPS